MWYFIRISTELFKLLLHRFIKFLLSSLFYFVHVNQALSMIFDPARNFLAPLKALNVKPKIGALELLRADFVEVFIDILAAIILIGLIIWFTTRFKLKYLRLNLSFWPVRDGAGVHAVLRKSQDAVQFDLALRDAKILDPRSWNWSVGLSSVFRWMLDDHDLFLLGGSEMLCWRIETAFVKWTTGKALGSVWCTYTRTLGLSLSELLPVSIPKITQNIRVAVTWTRMDKLFDLVVVLVIWLTLELLDLFQGPFDGYFWWAFDVWRRQCAGFVCILNLRLAK